MYGVVRILVFMTGVFVIPSLLVIIPLYLRHKIFADVILTVTESDVLEITDGISSVFCEGHTIKMNSPFNAFQLNTRVVEAEHRKHLRLSKSMSIPDDSLEYWGFFLNTGSHVNLSVCSKYEGGRIMVVKDTKDFHTCGLLEHNNKAKPEIRLNQDAVHVNREQYEGEDLREDAVDDSERRNPISKGNSTRNKRSIRKMLIMTRDGVLHGKTNETEDSSDSSFEESLITCYDGRILLNSNFTVSDQCTSNEYLESRKHVRIRHDVIEDGYYFYIFYNDNDLMNNEIHATFNIQKPTFENTRNVSSCIRRKECYFAVGLLSKDTVVVEIPMRNGIEHESDDQMTLTSTCTPRTAVYSCFPVAVLVLIILSAFIGSSTKTYRT